MVHVHGLAADNLASYRIIQVDWVPLAGFMKELEPVKKVLTDTLGGGFFQSALLVNLPASIRRCSVLRRHLD
jgi:hypothetical protein